MQEKYLCSKQAGLVWIKQFVSLLLQVDSTQYVADPCIFIWGKVVYTMYADISILLGPNSNKVSTIEEMKAPGLNLTVEGKSVTSQESKLSTRQRVLFI
jgi:hypothetical protein